MIAVYLLAAVAALVVYAATFRFSVAVRIAVAALVFLIPAVSLTLWIFMVGDRAPPDAVTVYPDRGKSVPAEKNRP